MLNFDVAHRPHSWVRLYIASLSWQLVLCQVPFGTMGARLSKKGFQANNIDDYYYFYYYDNNINNNNQVFSTTERHQRTTVITYVLAVTWTILTNKLKGSFLYLVLGFLLSTLALL